MSALIYYSVSEDSDKIAVDTCMFRANKCRIKECQFL